MTVPAPFNPATFNPATVDMTMLEPAPASAHSAAPEPDLPPDLELSMELGMARFRLLHDADWDSADYYERQALCRRARAMPHHPDVMRYRALVDGEMFTRRMQPAQSEQALGRQQKRLAKRAERALASCSQGMIAFYEQCAAERRLHGWGEQGDRAVGRVVPPTDNSEREELIERLVAKRAKLRDPHPGSRSELARAERERVKSINAEVKQRLEAIDATAKEQAAVDKATATYYRNLLAQQNPTITERREAETALRERRCRERYARPYAMRAAEDLAFIIQSGRRYPSAQGLNPFAIDWTRVKTFAHSKRGVI